MSCRFEDDLTAYADGELRPEERQRLDAHLPGCEECARALGSLQRAQALLRGLPPPAPSPALRRAVLSGLARAAPGGWPWLREALSGRGLAVAVGAAAVAGLLLLAQPAPPELQVGDPDQLEVAANLELLEDLDLLGLESPDDLEVVQELHQLGGLP